MRLWEIGKSPEPRVLTGARPDPGRGLNPPLDFSDDSSRLLRLHVQFKKRRAGGFAQHAALGVWNVASGHLVPGTERVTKSRMIAGRELNGAAFADGRDHVTLQWARVVSDEVLSSAGVFSLRDGREQRRLATDIEADDDFMARGKVLSLHTTGDGPDARYLNVDGSSAGRVTPQFFDGLDATTYYRTRFRPAEAAGDGPEYGVLSAVGDRRID